MKRSLLLIVAIFTFLSCTISHAEPTDFRAGLLTTVIQSDFEEHAVIDMFYSYGFIKYDDSESETLMSDDTIYMTLPPYGNVAVLVDNNRVLTMLLHFTPETKPEADELVRNITDALDGYPMSAEKHNSEQLDRLLGEMSIYRSWSFSDCIVVIQGDAETGLDRDHSLWINVFPIQ